MICTQPGKISLPLLFNNCWTLKWKQKRNSLKYVPYTDRKELANDLKTVYKASTEELGYTNLLELEEKWKHKYPGVIQSWIDNWEVLSVFFKFSAEIRKIMYTTNVIESLNST